MLVIRVGKRDCGPWAEFDWEPVGHHERNGNAADFYENDPDFHSLWCTGCNSLSGG